MLRLAIPAVFLSLFACCGGFATSPPAPPPAPTAPPTASPGIYWSYNAELGKITASTDNQTIPFPGLDKAMTYTVVLQRDFDGDGTQDAVVGISAGGSCCPTAYHFATIRPDGTPFLSVEFAASFELPTWENGTVVVKEEERVGYYRFDGSRGVDAGSTVIPELTAIQELRGTAPFQGGPPRSMVTDLNGDGQKEQIDCEVWERWGSLLCKINLPGGRWESPGCDRLGILEATNQGYHDLVCNRNIVFRFDGTTYQEVPQSP